MTSMIFTTSTYMLYVAFFLSVQMCLFDKIGPFTEMAKVLYLLPSCLFCPMVKRSRYIDGESGRRSDIPHHYIYTQDHNKNLTILDRQRVIRVIFEYVSIGKAIVFYNVAL